MIDLRLATPDDEPFLFQLYASTRAGEFAGWDEAQATNFVQMQFRAQAQGYALRFPAATSQIVVRDGVAVGRLLTDRTASEILLVDIALLPAHRQAGIGTALVRALQAEATAAGKSVRASVRAGSPARRLYKRLGFVESGEPGVYCELRWQPAPESLPAGASE